MTRERLFLYDTTLRDGAQTQGVDFSAEDKRTIAEALDTLGIDYVEGGWPGANPTDDAFFAAAPALGRAHLTAFGMTRRPGRSADNDPGLNALTDTPAAAVTLVAKTWDYHVDLALEISNDENLDLIADSIRHVAGTGAEAILDAEHFFDGYLANPDFALACLGAAMEADASFELLVRRELGQVPDFFSVDHYRVMVERRINALGREVTIAEATVKVTVDDERLLSVAEGNGPVNALDGALRKDLGRYSAYLEGLQLVDYKVRILTGGTEAVTRVLIESADDTGARWFTVGVSPNIVDASFQALHDSIVYKLYRDGAPTPREAAPI